MIHVETSERHIRQSSHRSIERAIAAAYAAGLDGTIVRITADTRTLAALRAAGEVIDTAGGETIDRGHRWAIVEAG